MINWDKIIIVMSYIMYKDSKLFTPHIFQKILELKELK